jgi:hypothetical protein
MGVVSCPAFEFIYICFSFTLFVCFFHCIEWKCILHWYGNANMALFE